MRILILQLVSFDLDFRNYGSLRHLVGFLGRGIWPIARSVLNTEHNIVKHGNTCMPRAGFERAITVID